MARRPKIKTPMANAHWEIKTEIQINGRNVTPNTELSISGERGRFRFIKYVNTGEAEWIDVWGGPKKSESWRSFRPDRVKTVHFKNRTDANLAVVYKQKQRDKKE
jgi:hypothetical protein